MKFKLIEENKYRFTEAKTSRVYGLLNSDNQQPMAIISPYRTTITDENGDVRFVTEEENQNRLKELKNKVRNTYGLGYTQIKSIWVEDGVDSSEYSLLIGPIDYKTAFKLAQEYQQTSFIFKDESGRIAEIYTTLSSDSFYKKYNIGDIIRVFKNSGQYLNINSAYQIFNHREQGAVSMPKGRGVNRPFTLKEVWEIYSPSPSYYQTQRREQRIL